MHRWVGKNLSGISRPILYFAPQHTVNRTMCRFPFPRARSVCAGLVGKFLSAIHWLPDPRGWDAPLGGRTWAADRGPFYTCSTTHCKQNYVPLSFSNGQGPSVSMRRAGRKVSVSGSLTSNSLLPATAPCKYVSGYLALSSEALVSTAAWKFASRWHKRWGYGGWANKVKNCPHRNLKVADVGCQFESQALEKRCNASGSWKGQHEPIKIACTFERVCHPCRSQYMPNL